MKNAWGILLVMVVAPGCWAEPRMDGFLCAGNIVDGVCQGGCANPAWTGPTCQLCVQANQTWPECGASVGDLSGPDATVTDTPTASDSSTPFDLWGQKDSDTADTVTPGTDTAVDVAPDVPPDVKPDVAPDVVTPDVQPDVPTQDTVVVAEPNDLLPWKLKDVQPESPGFNTTYGPKELAGKRLVVLCGAGWCASCVAQVEVMEKLKKSFEAKGKTDFTMAAINDASANSQKTALTNVSTFPIFQATTSSNGWAAQKCAKNDAFVYSAEGKQLYFFKGSAVVNITDFENKLKLYLNK